MYRHVENAYRGMINAPVRFNLGEAGRAFDARKNATMRRLNRYGGLHDLQSQRALDRGFNLERAATMAGSKNMTRDAWRDMARQNLNKYTQIGRDIVDYSGRGLSAAAAAEQQRKAEYEANKAQAKAQNQQAIATGVGAAVTIGTVVAMAW